MGLRDILDYLAPQSGAAATRATSYMPNFKWVGRGGDLRAGVFYLLEPLVYVFDSRRGGCEEPAAIDVSLPIANVTMPPRGRELSYWPSYRGLQPHQRRFYLQWLAGNRTTVPPELGYTFLFFYNLERRALVDRADIRLVAREVKRLRAMYASSGEKPSGSWEGYSGQFLWMLLLAHKETLSIEDVRSHIQTTTHWTEDNLAAALACLLIRECKLTASLAYCIAASLPQSMRSIVQRRVPGEFEQLFKTRFRELFPEGLQLQASSGKWSFLYRPASNVLSPVELASPNPFGVKSQFKPLSKIWNACIEDLKKLGSLARFGAEIDAVKKWEALPDALRAGTDHPLTDEFCKLVESRVDEGGQTIIPVGDIAAVLDPEGPTKLTAGRSRRLCQTAEQIGYFLEPDARLTGRAYGAGEAVIAFLKMSTSPIDVSRYGPAACMLQFGFLVAASDGAADERELQVISRHIESAFELQEDEVRRMERLRFLLQKTGPDRPLLRRLVKGLTKLQRQAIAKLLVAIILADGVVTPAERKSLKSACTLLAIEFAPIEALLPRETESDDPVTMIPATTGVLGEKVPPRPQESLALDRSAIAAILAETRDVAAMLAQAMATAGDEENDESEAAQARSIVAPTPAGPPESANPEEIDSRRPPAKYRAFHEALVIQDRWAIADAQGLARQHGFMLAGAIDVLNEWAAEAYGGQIFYEEAEFLVVERSLLR